MRRQAISTEGLEADDADVVAAGAVLWCPTDDGTQVALVHRPRYDDWSLPKGKLNPGESAPAAAVREVGEETGYPAVLGARLGDTHYQVAEGPKVVHYWAARAGKGEFTPNDEVDELRWMSLDSARELLSFDLDRTVLDRFRAQGRPPTSLLLVRHAKAGARQDWSGDDDLRPLTRKGHQQALRLRALLPLFGPCRVHAAAPVRCPATVRPLAEELGVPIVAEPLLDEDSYWRDPKAGLARLMKIAEGSGAAVVCSQGGVIPDLVTRLTGLPDPPSRKASTWVLGFRDAIVRTADYYPD